MPRLVLHGHWHHAHDTALSWIDRVATERSGALTWQATRVIGLSCDGDPNDGWLVLDLETLDVEWPTARAHPVGRDSAGNPAEVEP